MPRREPAALLITGTVGAGKTTTAAAIGDLLGEQGIPHAVLDLDWLRRAWPQPAADPFQLELELRNLAGVAANMREAGAERLVLAGVLEQEAVRARYAAAVGVPLVVCRLRVDLDRVRRRLVARHEPGRERDWHLARSVELDGILSAGRIGDAVVDVAEEPPAAVAARVLAAVGWT